MTLTLCFSLQWITPSENYAKNYYRQFIRTPFKWDDQTQNVITDAEHDDPKEVFPDAYVYYIETLYGKEKDKSKIECLGNPNSRVPSPRCEGVYYKDKKP